jgi:hypothetical protein
LRSWDGRLAAAAHSAPACTPPLDVALREAFDPARLSLCAASLTRAFILSLKLLFLVSFYKSAPTIDIDSGPNYIIAAWTRWARCRGRGSARQEGDNPRGHGRPRCVTSTDDGETGNRVMKLQGLRGGRDLRRAKLPGAFEFQNLGDRYVTISPAKTPMVECPWGYWAPAAPSALR